MKNTIRLYDLDSERKVFLARVTACMESRKNENSWETALDKTCFYPEGGGQPADLGCLIPSGSSDVIRVLDVQEEDGLIWHLTDRPLEIGSVIEGHIDWERRFDLMQQHSGEHIVSGLVHEHYGYNNVGFHMGSDVITIDFNGLLSLSQLKEVEEQANEIVWRNLPVRVWYPDQEELTDLQYRSKKEITGPIRMVQFPEADICACCGTHVTQTGAIGQIHILSVVKFHEGVRVEMICGKRVQRYLQLLDEQNHQISVQLSARPDQTAQAVQRLKDENTALRGSIHQLEEDLFSSEAERYADAGDVLLFREDMEPDSLRRLADAVMQTCGGRCAVFSLCPDGSSRYAIGQKDGNLLDFVKEMNQSLQGRGGGKPFFVQGQVQADQADILRWFEGVDQASSIRKIR